MFIVLLKFSANKAQAGQFMAGHNDWISCGFDDGVFLVSGSLQPRKGGAIVAHSTSLEELEVQVQGDPFVAQDVVNAQIIEISPARTDNKLAFLLEG